MIQHYNPVTVTEHTLRQFQASHGNWVRVGFVVQVPIEEHVDLRPFGQLRTWLSDPPDYEDADDSRG
jgi:hypothetical protein